MILYLDPDAIVLLFFSQSPFEDIRYEIKLENHSIVVHKSASRSGCAASCTVKTQCKSFNFCNKNICELNSADIFDVQRKYKAISISDCVYGGKKELSRPKCEEKGDEKDIQGVLYSLRFCAKLDSEDFITSNSEEIDSFS